MTRAIVGPGGGLVGPGGGELGPGPSTVTAIVPAGVVTFTPPAPTAGSIEIDVPAGVLTFSGPAPSFHEAAAVPAAILTLSAAAPAIGDLVGIPARVLTFSAPAPTVVLRTTIRVPAAVMAITGPRPYVSAVGDETGAPLTGPIRLFIDGFEMPNVEWSVSTEEVLGGVGRATITVQDRAFSDWEPTAHQDVRVVIRSSGWVLFSGETMQPGLSLPPGMPLRKWVIACRDYNAALDERAVGAPDGQNFWRPVSEDPVSHVVTYGEYRPVDPVARSFATDLDTVRFWVGHYLVIGGAIDYTTHVRQYIDNDILGDPQYAIDLQDAMTMLRPALEGLAAIAEVNIQFGLDADHKFYWLAIPAWQDLVGNLDTTDLPNAPYAIVDMADNPDGITTIGHGGIDPGFDGQAMPEAVYVQGATPAALLDDELNPQPGGSGWYPAIPGPQQRQAYLSVPGSWNPALRNRAGESAMRRARRQTLRGTVIVHGFTNADGQRESRDGWRPWQLLSISDARLPKSMKGSSGFSLDAAADDESVRLSWTLSDGSLPGRFVIQRVATTLYAGTDVRRYQIDFGDGPVGRMSQGGRKPADPVIGTAKRPIITWTTDWENFGPIGANETRDAVMTPRNGLGEPWGPPGVPVDFVIEARDVATGALVPSEGTCVPPSTVSEQDGKVRTTLHSSMTRSDLTYQVFAVTAIPPAP